jgi:hypothetical protein
MARTYEEIKTRVESLRRANAERDHRWNDVYSVRSGDTDTVMPGSMPDAWPKPIGANLIDTSARDMAEVMGAMPSINCSAGSLTTDKAKKFSSKKTKVANHYVQCSGLNAGRQVTAADHYTTYGMVIYSIEADFENKRPYIRVENPMGTYVEKNLFGQIKSYTKVWCEQAIHLVNKFPQLLKVLQTNNDRQSGGQGWAEREIEVVKYCDADQMVMFLPQHGQFLVSRMENPLGKIYISVGYRPGYDRETRGAFDDAIWVQLAKARMALLGLEATEKTVRAPLAVPRDVQKMTFGDDAVIRTDNPDKIRRVGIDVPSAAFQEGQMLEQELRVGTRTPEARSGNMDASIITGRGVQALMGGFNTVISTGQTVLSEALATAIELCFEMDEKLWPKEKKTVRGTVQGTPFEETYTPGKDINGDYTVDVTYGFAAGQDPARAIVGLLQLRGDQLISRDFFQRQLPMSIDVVQMQMQIDNEQMADAIKQGMMGYAQAIPQMALQGQDPVEAMKRLADMMKLREKGESIQDAVLKVFTPKEAPAGASQNPMEALLGAAGGAAGGGAPGGAAPNASPSGQPGAPQGMDLQSMLAGLTSGGEATMSTRTQRQSPI